ncbi:MAG TPA: flagellar biosynthesis anti-sigma factor FlgM [Gammaproteobacteria bacterium]|nr:flagellar biosynthesis anti-sigma factor FlgM [Gammaproteobacteria bacterium]
MEIENNRIVPPAGGSGGQGTPVENQNRDSAGGTPTAAAPGPGSDRVSLTDTARQLQELENRVAAEPVVDNQRVQAVRQSINDGSFQVDAERVAEKLIGIEQALTDAR